LFVDRPWWARAPIGALSPPYGAHSAAPLKCALPSPPPRGTPRCISEKSGNDATGSADGARRAKGGNKHDAACLHRCFHAARPAALDVRAGEGRRLAVGRQL